MNNDWLSGAFSHQNSTSEQLAMSLVKLKNTCNTCAAAKVKCGREKPSCSRCIERGQECYYAPSQRSGRRPTRASASQRCSRYPTTHQMPGSLTTSPQARHDSIFDGDQSDLSWLMYEPPDSLARSTPFIDDILGEYSSEFRDSNTMHHDVNMSGITSTPDMSVQVTDPIEQQGSNSCPSYSSFVPEDSPLWPSSDVQTPKGMKPPVSIASISMSDDAESPSSLSQESSVRLLRLLASLEREPTDVLQYTASPSKQNEGISPYVSRIVDRNSAALTSLEGILDNECILHHQQFLVIALVLSKVLEWYETVIMDRPASADLHTNDYIGSRLDTFNCDSISSSSSSAAKSAASHTLEPASHHERRMRAQLVLSELRHVIRALDRWTERRRPCSTESLRDLGSRSQGSASSIIILLFVESDLRDSLQRVARETKAGLD